MNLIPFQLKSKPAVAGSLDALFDEARAMGIVDLFTNQSSGKYSVTITFHTIDHVELKARSEHGCETPHIAFEQAIMAAKIIRAKFK